MKTMTRARTYRVMWSYTNDSQTTPEPCLRICCIWSQYVSRTPTAHAPALSTSRNPWSSCQIPTRQILFSRSYKISRTWAFAERTRQCWTYECIPSRSGTPQPGSILATPNTSSPISKQALLTCGWAKTSPMITTV